MAFDFPASPTVGQAYTLAGVSYVWNGYAWMQAGAPMVQGVQYPAHGGIRLSRLDNSNLKIEPYEGNRLIIGGESRPVTPVTIPRSGWGSGAIWFVYAYWTGTAMAYEVVATAPALWTDGIMIKTGDASRTLIAQFLILGDTNVIEDLAARRVILNWFNRVPKIMGAQISGSSAAVGTPAQIGPGGYFLAWRGTCVQTQLSAYITTNATDHVFTSARIDATNGAEAGENCLVGQYKTGVGTCGVEFATEGLHTFNAALRTTGAATATMQGFVYGTVWG